MLVRAYFDERGESEQRRKVVIPDTAHGTNPASVTMAGYELDEREDRRAREHRRRRPAREGRRAHRGADAHEPVDARALRREHQGDRARSSTAPARSCTTTARISTPSAGSRGPGDMGFDIVHINLHKTFSQPHGGGGPGGGPVAVRDDARAVPAGAAGRAGARTGRSGSTTTGRGRSAACAGSRGRSACSCARTRTSARTGRGLRDMSEAAVLNANYMLARLRDAYDLPFDRLVHARVRALGAEPEARARRHARSTSPSA